jgi:hypothetical protein
MTKLNVLVEFWGKGQGPAEILLEPIMELGFHMPPLQFSNSTDCIQF